jgi:hypothetical protein
MSFEKSDLSHFIQLAKSTITIDTILSTIESNDTKFHASVDQ